MAVCATCLRRRRAPRRDLHTSTGTFCDVALARRDGARHATIAGDRKAQARMSADLKSDSRRYRRRYPRCFWVRSAEIRSRAFLTSPSEPVQRGGSLSINDLPNTPTLVVRHVESSVRPLGQADGAMGGA